MNVREYQLGGGILREKKSGVIDSGNNRKIRVEWIGKELYLIDGFPAGRDFICFRGVAQELLDESLERGKFKNP